MADAVTATKLYESAADKRCVLLLTSVSDGTGESAVVKLDISGLPATAPSAVRIHKIKWCIKTMSVRLLFDHTTDDEVLVLSGDGSFEFPHKVARLDDPASAGGSGDLLLTTVAHAANATYSILIELGWD